MEDSCKRSHASYSRSFQGFSSLNTDTLDRTTKKETKDVVSFVDVCILVKKMILKYVKLCISPFREQSVLSKTDKKTTGYRLLTCVIKCWRKNLYPTFDSHLPSLFFFYASHLLLLFKMCWVILLFLILCYAFTSNPYICLL